MDVQLPDGTTVQGVPDGTSKADLAQKLKANGRDVPDDWLKPAESQGLFKNAVGAVAEPIANMATGMAGKVAGDVAGLSGLTSELISPKGGDPRAFQQHVQESMTYQPRTTAGKAVTEYNPLALIAKAIGWGAEKAGGAVRGEAGADTARGMAGNALQEGMIQAPGFIGAAGPKAAGAASSALKGEARDMMQSALKPPLAAQRTGKSAKAIDTLLDEGINVTAGGRELLQERISGLNDKISNLIKNSSATVDKGTVASTLQDALNKFEKQVTPMSDLRAIENAWKEFVDHPLLVGKQAIPVKQAQEMKQGTYRSLGDKSYGELKGADIEAQKTLARGLKEEIAKAVPEVRALNAEESKLLNALTLVERRVMMEANKNPIGLGWLSTNPSHLLGWMADRSGLFKSLIARMLNTGSKAAPPIGEIAPLGGFVVGQRAGQIEQPPAQ